ncbi:MAG: glycosyltransferase [Bacteroidota bacterium]
MDKKNILICPLDWGLGHASRMVPVIDMIENKGANVIMAADNYPLEFLRQRFPNNTTIKLKGFSPKYPIDGNMAMEMIKSFPKMISEGKRANAELQKIITQHNISAVISDNRYELSTTKVPSVFITHQLNIQTSGWQAIGKPVINQMINHYLNKFSEIWIPDVIGNFRLSGSLSATSKFKDKLFNIGLLSRFKQTNNNGKYDGVDLLIILSGPEPQRTILEELLLSQALKTDLTTIMLLAKPGENINKQVKNVKLLSHLPDEEFASLIQSAKIVVSRPGYSTLMDLAVFNKNAIFIPTPGQTEQEYLATRLLKEGIAFSQSQHTFDLSDSILHSSEFKGLHIKNETKLLEEKIENLLRNC